VYAVDQVDILPLLAQPLQADPVGDEAGIVITADPARADDERHQHKRSGHAGGCLSAGSASDLVC